jgi:hypothetical protein
MTEHEYITALEAMLRDLMRVQNQTLVKVLDEYRAAQSVALHEIKDAMIEALREIKAALISSRGPNDSERQRLDS